MALNGSYKTIDDHTNPAAERTIFQLLEVTSQANGVKFEKVAPKQSHAER
jgi:hypothetical protein